MEVILIPEETEGFRNIGMEINPFQTELFRHTEGLYLRSFLLTISISKSEALNFTIRICNLNETIIFVRFIWL